MTDRHPSFKCKSMGGEVLTVSGYFSLSYPTVIVNALSTLLTLLTYKG